MKRILLLFATLGCLYSLHAAVISIGNGNVATYNAPINPYQNSYGWSSMIYTSSEIGTSGDITSIELGLNSGSATRLSQKIYMSQTPNSSFSSTAKPDPTSMTLVYSGDIVFSGSTWIKIDLNTPFNYNNSSNLMIYWEDNHTYYSSISMSFIATDITDKCIYNHSGTEFPLTDGTIETNRPDIKLHIPSSHDLSATGWIIPQTKGTFTTTESVRIQFKNEGLNSESNFTVAYSIDGGDNFTEEVYTSTLTPGATAYYTFTQKADLSADGFYNCIAKVALTGDEVSENNTYEITIENKIPGDVCSDPITITSTTYTDTKNIGNYADDYTSIGSNCASNYMQEFDVVYTFTTTTAENYVDVFLDSNTSGIPVTKVGIHLLSGCPESVSSCMTYGIGNYTAELLDGELPLAHTYYLLISSWYDNPFIYDLSVEIFKQTDFKTFKFTSPTTTGEIDYENKTITLLVPMGTDLSALTPYFTIPANAKVMYDGSELTSGTTEVDFTTPVQMSVIKTDDSMMEEWTITVSEDQTTNVNQLQLKLSVSPNPVINNLTVNLNNSISTLCRVTILNSVGEVVQTERIQTNEQSIQIDASKIPSGIYFLNLKNGDKESVIKFIKQ